MNKKQRLHEIVEETTNVKEFQELFYYFKKVGIQKFFEIEIEKKEEQKYRDTRNFLKLVSKFYDENPKLRNRVVRFKKKILRSFDSSTYAVENPNENSEKARNGNKIIMQDIYDRIDEYGLNGLVNRNHRNVGKKTQEAFLKFIEKTKLN